MAVILNLEHPKENLSYLSAYHCIGRSALNVDTVINAPEISRTHAAIEWRDNQWFIRDISSNGTWINNNKLVKDQFYKLKVGDKLFFAKANAHGYLVQDLSAPQNMLHAVDSSKSDSAQYIAGIAPITLSDYNLLPSEQSPEIILFYVPSKNQWYKEHIDDPEAKAYPVANLDILRFDNQDWQLKLNIPTENTVQLAKAKLSADQIIYHFNLSQDEEHTELNITTNDKKFCLSNKVHHYLTLSLARHRDEDAKKGIDDHNQGWRLRELIVDELGYDISRFNTQLSRAKKQFIETLDGVCDADALIERKGGKIRFSGSVYRIYKGDKLTVNRGLNNVSFPTLNG